MSLNIKKQYFKIFLGKKENERYQSLFKTILTDEWEEEGFSKNHPGPVRNYAKKLDETRRLSIHMSENGFAHSFYFSKNLSIHREDGPAIIRLSHNSKSGKIFIEEKSWYIDNKRHREDGPAMIEYYGNGQIKRKTWFINNVRHRKDGPAVIRYNQDGSISSESYYLNGKYLINPFSHFKN